MFFRKMLSPKILELYLDCLSRYSSLPLSPWRALSYVRVRIYMFNFIEPRKKSKIRTQSLVQILFRHFHDATCGVVARHKAFELEFSPLGRPKDKNHQKAIFQNFLKILEYLRWHVNSSFWMRIVGQMC